MTTNRFVKIFHLFTGLCLALSACTLPGRTATNSSSTVLTWIDQPRDGSTIPLAPMPIKASARNSTSGGVVRIDILVNGVGVGTVPVDGSQTLAQAEAGWNPSQPGSYAIQSRAYDQNGGSSLSEISHVCVTGANGQTQSAANPATDCPIPAGTNLPAPAAPIQVNPQITVAQTPIAQITEETTPRPVLDIPIKVGANPNPAFYGKCDKEPTLITFEAYPGDASAAIEVTLFISLLDNSGGRHEAGVYGMTPNSSGGFTYSLDTNSLDRAFLGDVYGTLLYTIKLMNAQKEFYASSQELPVNLWACLLTQAQNTSPLPATWTPEPIVITNTPQPPAIITNTPAPLAPQKPVTYMSANPVYYITGCGENSLTISAQVSDASNVRQVKIHWIYLGGANNPGTEKIFDMNPAGPSSYSLTIMDPKLHTAYPNLNGGNGKIQYWIDVLYKSGLKLSSDVNYVEALFCPG